MTLNQKKRIDMRNMRALSVTIEKLRPISKVFEDKKSNRHTQTG